MRSVAAELEQAFPGLAVADKPFPLPPWRSAAVKVLTAVQWGSLILAFGGDRIFAAVGFQEPPWLASIRDNKLAMIGAYFGCNIVAQTLSSSGAFEVRFRGQTLWSALAHGGQVPATSLLARRLIDDFGLEAAPQYAARLRASGLYDFDDLLLEAVRLLTEVEDVRLACRDRWRHVLVDEYQDCLLYTSPSPRD